MFRSIFVSPNPIFTLFPHIFLNFPPKKTCDLFPQKDFSIFVYIFSIYCVLFFYLAAMYPFLCTSFERADFTCMYFCWKGMCCCVCGQGEKRSDLYEVMLLLCFDLCLTVVCHCCFSYGFC